MLTAYSCDDRFWGSYADCLLELLRIQEKASDYFAPVRRNT